MPGSAPRSTLLRFLPWILILFIGFQETPAARGADADQLKALAEEILSSTGIPGGLCVHLGCGDGTLTAQLSQGGKLLVHGIDPSGKSVDQARQNIQARGIYGPVSVEQCSLAQLPYPDNMVNLVVVDDLPRLQAAGLSLHEVMRVLCPNGVAYLGQSALVPGAGKLSPEDLKTALAAGDTLSVRNQVFDRHNGEKPKNAPDRYLRGGILGLLYDTTGRYWAANWLDRAYWQHGNAEGHLLVFAGDRTFGVVGRTAKGDIVRSYDGPKEYELFCRQRDGRGQPIKEPSGWSVRLPIHQQVTALLLAGDKLFVGGILDNAAEPMVAKLWIYSAGDGKPLGSCVLENRPVFDGLAGTAGRLYLATQDGKLVCLGK